MVMTVCICCILKGSESTAISFSCNRIHAFFQGDCRFLVTLQFKFFTKVEPRMVKDLSKTEKLSCNANGNLFFYNKISVKF